MDCNNISCDCGNNNKRILPRIKHVYGNVLRLAIPLTLRIITKDDDEIVATDTDFIPSSEHPVKVVLSKGKLVYPLDATMDGNLAVVEDKGKLPAGTYDISVECFDDLGNRYRFKQNAVLYVTDTTAEAGIDTEIEYEAQTWYLDAAVFLATTEIGDIGDVLDNKLDDLFGNAVYDANNREILFYNKDNTKVLAAIDARQFTIDGTVSNVYINTTTQTLYVVLNEDAGNRVFPVPLYLVFNEYYKKGEVDRRIGASVTDAQLQYNEKLPLIVPVTQNGSGFSSTMGFGVISNAIYEDGREVVAKVNDGAFLQLFRASEDEITFSLVSAEDGVQSLLSVNDNDEWSLNDVELSTGGSGGGYQPPVGGIPKTDLAPAVQASLNKADTAVQPADLEGYATTDDVDDAVAALVSSAPQTLDTLKELADALGDDPNFATTITTALGNKVDKESGKGLSTNDYTTAEKTKLAGIAEGAEVNVNADWNASSGDAQILNKPNLATVATSGDYDDLTNKPTLFSGSYNDLTNKPTIPDVSGYATTAAMNTALAGKQDTLTFDTTPTANSTNPVTSGGIKTYVDGKATITGITTSQDGTFTISLSDGNSYTVNLNHVHPQYLKYELLEDEAEYTALATKDSSTLYLIPVEEE